MKNLAVFSVGLGIFTLLFGPGNIIYPLSLGAATGSMWWCALLGFIITAVLVPIIGLLASLVCYGDYMIILSYLGKIPGMTMAFMCMLLIGPFCIIPRCIALAREIVIEYTGPVSPLLFSIFATIAIFAMTLRKEAIMPLFGRVFGPIKLTFIAAFFIAACFGAPVMVATHISSLQSFTKGLFEGYGTMDLLGTLFCTGLVAMQAGVKTRMRSCSEHVQVLCQGLKIGAVGGGILTVVYAAFFYVSGKYAGLVQGVDHTAMFTVIAEHLFGASGHLLASTVILLTCITTVMALSAIFAEYVRIQLFNYRCSYVTALSLTVIIAGAMSNAGFGLIMATVEPIVAIVYPVLIMLALGVIWYKLFCKQSVCLINPASVSNDESVVVHQPLNKKQQTMER